MNPVSSRTTIQFDAGPSTKKTPGDGSDVLAEACH
jgi:hypothetical protein